MSSKKETSKTDKDIQINVTLFLPDGFALHYDDVQRPKREHGYLAFWTANGQYVESTLPFKVTSFKRVLS